MMNKSSDWGIIGLGTIGINISINFSRNGIKLSIYNRHVDGLEENVAQNIVKRNKGLKDVLTFDNIESFVKSIKKPRMLNRSISLHQFLINSFIIINFFNNYVFKLISSIFKIIKLIKWRTSRRKKNGRFDFRTMQI